MSSSGASATQYLWPLFDMSEATCTTNVNGSTRSSVNPGGVYSMCGSDFDLWFAQIVPTPEVVEGSPSATTSPSTVPQGGTTTVTTGSWDSDSAITVTANSDPVVLDHATVDDGGYIYLVGRKQELIISGGENVYPVEVEQALSAHPAVLEVAVFGLPDPVWGERVAAAVTGSDALKGVRSARRWWEFLIVVAAVSVFVWLAMLVEKQDIALDTPWLLTIAAASLALLAGAVMLLWKRTRFA